MKYEIEKNLEIPLRGQHVAYPFDKMEIGDSFQFHYGNYSRIDAAKRRYVKKNPGKQFSIRRVDTTVYRIWRVA